MFKFGLVKSALEKTIPLKTLFSPIEVCPVCPEASPINFEGRSEEKEPLTVYGMDGTYQVLAFDCRGLKDFTT